MTALRSLLLLGLFATAAPASAQPDDGFRFGLTLGGISTAGIVVEAFDRHGSTEINLGTFGFRDLSISAVRRHYPGRARVRPTVGIGLWAVIGLAAEEGERTAASLVLRAPIGVEWRPADRHALTFDINLNRGLLIRRADPSDDTPMSRRLIPLPGIAYRWWDGG